MGVSCLIKPYLLSYYKNMTKKGYKSSTQMQIYLFSEVLLKLTLIHLPLPLKGSGEKETERKYFKNGKGYKDTRQKSKMHNR